MELDLKRTDRASSDGPDAAALPARDPLGCTRLIAKQENGLLPSKAAK